MGYKRNAVINIGWMGVVRGLTKFLSIVKITIAARILGPSGFGVYAVASLVLAFLEIFTETGTNAILIQNNRKFNKYIDTCWIISIARGIVIFLLILIISKPVSVFFNQPEAIKLILLISFVPLIKGFVNPSEVIFQKNLKFKKELYFRTPIIVTETVASIILLIITKDASSMIWGMLCASIIEVIISWIFIKPHPVLTFNRNVAKDIFDQGKWISSTGVLNYLYSQGDDWIVGSLMNTYSLGLYQMAYKIATLTVTESSEIVLKVAFPSFVKIRGDKEKLRRLYFINLIFLIIASVPVSIILYLFADRIILIFLGKEWINIIRVVRILIIFSTLRSLFGSCSALFLAVRKQKYNAYILFVTTAVMIITIIPLTMRYGIEGTAYSVLLSWILVIPLIIKLVYKVLTPDDL